MKTVGLYDERIFIYYDETDQRVLSVSARNVPTEYEVYYTIEYAIDGSTGRLLETQDLTVTRNYTYDSTLVLGKAREEELLREALPSQAVTFTQGAKVLEVEEKPYTQKPAAPFTTSTLQQEAGRALDPTVVGMFVKNFAKFEAKVGADVKAASPSLQIAAE